METEYGKMEVKSAFAIYLVTQPPALGWWCDIHRTGRVYNAGTDRGQWAKLIAECFRAAYEHLRGDITTEFGEVSSDS